MIKITNNFLSRFCLNATFVIITYPMIIISLSGIWIYFNGFKLSDFLYIAVSYYICNIAIGVGMHRYWAHNSFSMNKYMELIFCLLTAATLQSPIIVWSSDHAKHHAFTDTEQDPHSPLKFGGGIKGFLWSHCGWMLSRDKTKHDFHKPTFTRLSKKNFVMWQMRYYGLIASAMNIVLPFVIGYLIGLSWKSGVSSLLFCAIGRLLQQQSTFCINSITHFFGKKSYYNGTAGDIWWMSPLLLGENYHNFHHAFPSDYRNGNKWYHFDTHKWIIYIMYKLGLAWDLKITSKTRLENAQKTIVKNYLHQVESRWSVMKEKVDKGTNIIKSIIVTNKQIKKIEKVSLLCKQYLSEVHSLIELEEFKNATYKKCLKLLKAIEQSVSIIENVNAMHKA